MTRREEPWLEIIGIGEDGVAGLSETARSLVEDAEVIVGGDRHHKLSDNTSARRIAWPSPFDAMIGEIKKHKGKQIVILVTGDPLWYSVGARILKAIPAAEIRFHPQLSAFQWAACRMGWSLADCGTLTVHGRDVSQIVPHFAPNARLLVLTRDGQSPNEIAELLKQRGYGKSKLTALCALGGQNEKRFEGNAARWKKAVPDFHTLAVECLADPAAPLLTRQAGLPDDAYTHDGQMTKQVVRAATLANLSPYPDALLWDVGAGCGSVAVEWMRAARGARAIAIEPVPARQKMIEQNRTVLGVPKLEIVAGKAPHALKGLPVPDAVFIGGGISEKGVFETCWRRLRTGGRLAANAVTVESEMQVLALQEKHGGSLSRISVQQAEPVGRFKGWKPAMPVTQWVVVKGGKG